ncbi:putative protein kinase RLK-Pelle-LRR-III family [Helianthus annuus]|nr:putative protein kinase RLK-Pelle-LRR-III family [Helianthus annuus]KAJ0530888.1 putative protein kinase RLK-Pelle-LRR-III family [Helianthus annuus]
MKREGTKRKEDKARKAGGKLVHFDGSNVFTADDLLRASVEMTSKSTYGFNYKATLENGDEVSVQTWSEYITKDGEYEVELNLLGKIRHPNVFAIRAYYLASEQEEYNHLVFYYMPEKSQLSVFLHHWATRMQIAKGVARGLHNLHTHHKLIHGNLTSHYVLLDENNNHKISDFGMSRLMHAHVNSHHIAADKTLGYQAPEVSKLKEVDMKTDVHRLLGPSLS